MAKVTVADLARECGVSTATVSMVLSNKGRISAGTRQKVMTAIEKLGYVYNQQAANFRSQTSNQVGLLLQDITNPFYSELVAGLSHQTEMNGMMMFIGNSEESIERQQKFVEAISRNSACGLILCLARNTPVSFITRLKKLSFPVVLVARPSPGLPFDYVGTDNVSGARLATDHLISLGHRNIAFIGGLPDSVSRIHRIEGYSSRLLEAGIEPDANWIISCESTRAAGAKAVTALLTRYPQITAIVFHQDIIALGAVQGLRRMGRIIGKDISIVGFDDVPEASLIEPSLTTISVEAHEIGRVAGEILLTRLADNQAPPQTIILYPTLIKRDSSGCCPIIPAETADRT
ncbi:LacI family DNA-binding transcriptional regulator [Erwinia pyri]|uniref:LacI family DNA-binding transcriptional regulator n=1 Tax=Erwinia pyri TaxID=3062598 RepID=A0AA50DF59_9GAMM|nr:LacI family DNA-binding transcriptional regulator [Erwinia sp. DE2]WLS76960.1 LacI family DNA-binding transcriptional regulator [Erwinia sp. DE2]